MTCHCSNLVSLWHKMTFWPLSNKNIHSPISAVNVYSFGRRKLRASGLKIRHVLYLSTTEGDINKYQISMHRMCLMPCRILSFYYTTVIILLLKCEIWVCSAWKQASDIYSRPRWNWTTFWFQDPLKLFTPSLQLMPKANSVVYAEWC